jgi:dienelactone hydrolase
MCGARPFHFWLARRAASTRRVAANIARLRARASKLRQSSIERTMHLGEEDEFISKTAQAQIKAALAGKANATVYSYPGQRHAFSRHNGLHYNAAAAALANRRTSEFLHQQLR